MVVTKVVVDAKMLADVVKDIRSGRDDDIHVPVLHEIDQALLHTGRDHGSRQAEEDGTAGILAHPGPDLERLPEFPPLKPGGTHPMKQPGEIVCR
jgi:hypothetical protein